MTKGAKKSKLREEIKKAEYTNAELKDLLWRAHGALWTRDWPIDAFKPIWDLIKELQAACPDHMNKALAEKDAEIAAAKDGTNA